jgi:F-type H+-transporting ATPase subunit b
MGPIFLGIDSLGFNLPALVAQLINFVILLVVFRLLLYKPLLKMLDERKRRIAEGLEASDEAKKRLSETELEVAKELDRARQQGQAMIVEAQQAAARLQEESRQAARAEAEQLLERARGEIQLERDAAIAQIRTQFADLTVTAAERIIKRNLDRDAQSQIIQEVLAEAADGGRN